MILRLSIFLCVACVSVEESIVSRIEERTSRQAEPTVRSFVECGVSSGNRKERQCHIGQGVSPQILVVCLILDRWLWTVVNADSVFPHCVSLFARRVRSA